MTFAASSAVEPRPAWADVLAAHLPNVDALVTDLRYTPVRWAWVWGLAVAGIGVVALVGPRRRRWGRPGRGARLAVVMVGLMALVAIAWPRGRCARSCHTQATTPRVSRSTSSWAFFSMSGYPD